MCQFYTVEIGICIVHKKFSYAVGINICISNVHKQITKGNIISDLPIGMWVERYII